MASCLPNGVRGFTVVVGLVALGIVGCGCLGSDSSAPPIDFAHPVVTVRQAALRTAAAGPVEVSYDAHGVEKELGPLISHDVGQGSADFGAEKTATVITQTDSTTSQPSYLAEIGSANTEYVALATGPSMSKVATRWNLHRPRVVECSAISFEDTLAAFAMKYLSTAVAARPIADSSLSSGEHEFVVTIDPAKLIGSPSPDAPFSGLAAMSYRVKLSAAKDPRAVQFRVVIDSHGRISQLSNTTKLCFPGSSYSDTLTVTGWHADPIPDKPTT